MISILNFNEYKIIYYNNHEINKKKIKNSWINKIGCKILLIIINMISIYNYKH